MSKFKIHYRKPELIDLPVLAKQYEENNDENSQYNAFNIQQLQLYQPIYKLFFEMNKNNYSSIALNHKYHIVDCNHISEGKSIIEKEVFFKFSPLLDPYRYMIGKYNINDKRIFMLPSFDSDEMSVNQKILLHHNASYIDSFFCFLTSILLNHHNVLHGLDFYGSYLGIQDKHKVSLTDDVEYLRNSEYFNNNIGKLFYIDDKNEDFSFNPFLMMQNSRKNKQKIQLQSDDDVIDLDIEELTEHFQSTSETSDVFEEIYKKKDVSSSDSSVDSSSDSDVNYSSDEDNNSEGSSEDETSNSSVSSEIETSETDTSSEEEEIYGYIHNFPVQIICMEKCNGTLDRLFVNNEINEKNGASVLFQVIMILILYQKTFKFTHNDLHTNNIMYVETNIEHLYYQYNGIKYKVPTYGKIFKIIDFGRAIFKFQGHQLCSDSFSKDGDASTQYNCEPFLNNSKPRLEPNNSFDLCRLGCSLFDFIMDYDDEDKDLDELQKTVKRWCMDDNGKNVLYKKTGEERYPSFKLYKMIARSVHGHDPEKQLDYPYFNQFLTNENGENVLNIDEIPYYYEK
tara:strand:+ start:3511 stop:5211 length:1701 start_codon:yes stop_codon:yes gene_type:complete